MNYNLLALAFALSIAACTALPDQWAAECRTAEARLAALGIDSSEIERIDSVTDRGTEGAIISRHAWARLKSCTGYVVVRLDADCNHSDPYTTGNCHLPQRRGA